jgi:SAM-dependent methyltransferase
MSTHKPTIAGNWFKDTFDALYPIIYAHRTVEAATTESLFAIQQLQLQRHERVLDLCCGGGRHIAHLRRASDHVFGLDYSSHLLTLAQEELGAETPVVRGDMRHLPFQNAFDVVTNFFTSFGYFEAPSENVKVAQDLARALKPNGRFFIDYIAQDYTIAHLDPESHRVAGGFDVYENRWIDRDTMRVNKATVIKQGGDEIKHTGESVRLYSQDEFIAILEHGGLRVDTLYGDYTGAACSPDHPRMIAVGRKA